MPDGKHCPECGKDIGYWAVALGLFRLRCPHCQTRLHHRLDSRMTAITNTVVILDVIVSIVPGALVGVAAFHSVGWLAALVAGFAVWIGLSFGFGLVFLVIVAPVLRRTQRLVVAGEPDTPAEEESW